MATSGGELERKMDHETGDEKHVKIGITHALLMSTSLMRQVCMKTKDERERMDDITRDREFTEAQFRNKKQDTSWRFGMWYSSLLLGSNQDWPMHVLR